jgi:flagellar basal-body rod modification protein FlgD
MATTNAPTTPPTVPVGGMWSATRPGTKAPENELGKDAFLKLLVAQMKYQDPMNPAGGTEFIAQTAQFTVVEQLTSMAKQNEELLASQQSLTASTFIGRDVAWEITNDEGEKVLKTGTVTGVSFTADGPTLRVGKEDIALSRIKVVAPVIDDGSETEEPDETDPDTDPVEETDTENDTTPVAGSAEDDSTTDPATDGTTTETAPTGETSGDPAT